MSHIQRAPVRPGIAPDLPRVTPREVRDTLLARQEILLADLREEDPFAQGHPLWAANFPLGRLELDAVRRVPRRDVRIVLYGHDGHRDLAPEGARVLRDLGYGNVSLLEGGLDGWIAAGFETFIDVNVPSKAFGELVEARRGTPLLPAEEVARMIASDRPPVVLDARRFDEFATMSIPSGISVPGAELVLRVRALAPDPETPVIVNCAGRTRSIIGTQSLLDAGIPNPVAGLRNGTIGWTLAGLALDTGASRSFGAVPPEVRAQAARDARAVARRAGVRQLPLAEAEALVRPDRTVYRIDVRPPGEYDAGHLPGFANVPGGQLVQETDHAIPVRGALVFLADDDGTRADMTASWLAQMGWEVHVIAPRPAADRAPRTAAAEPPAALPAVPRIGVEELAAHLASGPEEVRVLDVSPSAVHVAGHVPGAWFALRSQLEQALAKVPAARHLVVTAPSEEAADLAAADLARLTGQEVRVLSGGLAAWRAAGHPVASGEGRLASPRIDRYRRPYEGTDASRAAMQAYLDWEYGLVAQLDRDATHFFEVLED